MFVPSLPLGHQAVVTSPQLQLRTTPWTVDEFKRQLLTRDLDDFVREVVLASEAAHFGVDEHDYVKVRIAESFGVEVSDVQLWIVGSAKVGFSLMEKRVGNNLLPAFRPFSAASDVDVAVVCTAIFNSIWTELSRYANRSPVMPWNSGKLGDYLVHGWLRPDQFPRGKLIKCNLWWDIFRRFSTDRRLGRRKLRGGIFQSVDDLLLYQKRGFKRCLKELEISA